MEHVSSSFLRENMSDHVLLHPHTGWIYMLVGNHLLSEFQGDCFIVVYPQCCCEAVQSQFDSWFFVRDIILLSPLPKACRAFCCARGSECSWFHFGEQPLSSAGQSTCILSLTSFISKQFSRWFLLLFLSGIPFVCVEPPGRVLLEFSCLLCFPFLSVSLSSPAPSVGPSPERVWEALCNGTHHILASLVLTWCLLLLHLLVLLQTWRPVSYLLPALISCIYFHWLLYSSSSYIPFVATAQKTYAKFFLCICVF